MELYKERDFGALLSDSFTFFRKHGKNYFKNYLTINGGLLLLLVVLVAVGFKDIISQFFNSNMNGNSSSYFEAYFQENTGVFIFVCLAIVALMVLINFVNYCYPVLYLNMYAEKGRADFQTHELVDVIRTKIGKFVIFTIFSMFILLPLACFALILNVGLVFLIIGIFLFFITIPAIINIINFTFIDYILNDIGVFEAFGNAVGIQFSKGFWKYIGATMVSYIIIQIATSVFTMIPTSFISIETIVSTKKIDESFTVIMTIVYVITMVVSIIASNLVYVVATLMYFDSRKDLHQIEQFKEIDSIGLR